MTPEIQEIVHEIKKNSRRLRNLDLQATKLYERLRFIQKNFFDDMDILPGARYTGPWRYYKLKNKFAWWNVTPVYLNPELPHMLEVVIKKHGHEKDIVVLDQICKRLQLLDTMAKELSERQDELKNYMRDSGNWDVVAQLKDIE